MIKTKHKEIGAQLIRFCFSGGAGVVAGYVTLYALTEFAGLWYLFSSIAAGLVNGGINFFLEKFWTFKNKDTGVIYRQAGLYTLVRLALFGADVGLLYLLVEYAHIYYLVAQVGITIILSLASFVLCRKIFLPKEDRTSYQQ